MADEDRAMVAPDPDWEISQREADLIRECCHNIRYPEVQYSHDPLEVAQRAVDFCASQAKIITEVIDGAREIKS